MLYIKNSVHTKWKAEMARTNLFISVYFFLLASLFWISFFDGIHSIFQNNRLKKTTSAGCVCCCYCWWWWWKSPRKAFIKNEERKKKLPITNYICNKNGVCLIYIQIIDTKTISRFYSFKCKHNMKSHLDFGISNRMVRIKYYTHPVWVYALPPNQTKLIPICTL